MFCRTIDSATFIPRPLRMAPTVDSMTTRSASTCREIRREIATTKRIEKITTTTSNSNRENPKDLVLALLLIFIWAWARNMVLPHSMNIGYVNTIGYQEMFV